MDLQLDDKVAVVIGAAAGIGRAVAEAFAAEGAAVACVDRSNRVEQVADAIKQSTPAKATGLQADVTNPESLAEAARQIKATYGTYHHVVCTAGIGSGKFGFPFWNLRAEDWPRVVEVNLLGTVHVAHAFSPELVANRRGTLLFFASVAGQIGSQTDPPYSAAKAGVINFSQCAAKDLAAYGVRVNCLCPGMVKTELNRDVWAAWADRQPPEKRLSYEDWAGEKVRRVVPLGRWQEPEDLAVMAVFLASDRAKNVTGQTINVDGGFVMHW